MTYDADIQEVIAICDENIAALKGLRNNALDDPETYKNGIEYQKEINQYKLIRKVVTRTPPPPSGDAVRLADDEFPDEVWIATDQRWYSSERHESLPSYKYIRADLIKPEPVAGLEVLKREVFESVKDGLISGNTIEGLGDVGIVLDHLARAGHLRPAVPREVIDALDRLHVNADYNGCLRDFRTVAAALDPYMEKRE